MATTVGEIVLLAKIDTTQYKSGAKEIERTNKNIESSSDSSSSKIGGSFSRAAAVASAAIVAAGALMVKSFIDSGSEIQSLRASFESLTGNVSDTNAVMTTLYDLGKKTAFSNKDIQSAGRSFLATGVAVDDLGTLLSQTADIAGATGADLGQLTLPLTQTLARGKLQTQDFYQIMNAGAGALRKPLTDLAGKKGFGTLADAMEKGAITSEDLLTVMGQVTKQGGFAFQGAIKQSEKFAGRMSNLQEGITNIGLSILGVDAVTGKVDPDGIFSKLSNAVKIATGWLEKNKDKINEVATAVEVFLTPAIGAIGLLLEGVMKFAVWAAENKDWLMPLIGGLIAFKGALMLWDAVDAARVVLTTFQLVTIPSVMASFSAFTAMLMTPVTVAAIGVGAIIAVYNAAQQAIGALNDLDVAMGNSSRITEEIRQAAQKAKASGDIEKYNKFQKVYMDSLNRDIAISKEASKINFFSGLGTGLKKIGLGGWATGGFTGRGGANEIAGLVHKGEYVLPQDMVNQATGLPNLSGANNGASITINVSGTIVSSPQDQRKFAEVIGKRLNEVLQSKGQQPIASGI